MTTPEPIGRRTAIKMGLAAAAAAALPTRRARAQAPKEVKIALVVPLSGAWARQGILEQMGAEMAIEDVNKARRHQGPRRRQAEAGALRHRRHRGEGQERRAAPGGAGARRGRRHRLLAVELHARGHRGVGARGAAVAHAVLLRPDHRPRLQVRLPVVADRGGPVHRAAAAHRRPGDQGHRRQADEGGVRRRQLGLLGELHEAHPRARGQGPGPHDRGGRGLHPAARGRDHAGAEDPLRPARLHRVPVHERGRRQAPDRQVRGAGDHALAPSR